MKKKESKKYILRAVGLIILLVVLFFIYLILDFLDISSIFGLNFNSVNTDLLGIVLNSLVVILLYIISFYAIEKHQQSKADEAEKRELQKAKNIKSIVKLLIDNTYKECCGVLEMIGNKEILNKYVIPKIDFNKSLFDNLAINRLINKPFKNYEQIIRFAEKGYVTRDELEKYLRVKNDFQSVVDMKITFFDIDDVKDKNEEQEYLEQKINEDYNLLFRELKERIDK